MVKIKIPVTKRIIPPIFDIKLIFFLKFLENNKNLWIKYPDKTKGIASPKEYKINNMTALVKVSSIDAKAKIEPKIGGITLLVTGILILTNQLQAIGFYIIKVFPFMQNFG